MLPKQRILVFPFDLMSHYLRCIVLANTYDKNRYEVLFLSSTNYDSFLEKHGYKTFSCKQFDAKKVMQCAEKFDFSWLNKTDVEQVFLSQVQVITLLKPILVIGDIAPTLKMAAEFTQVNYTAITNGYLTKYYAFTRKLSRTHKAYAYSKKLPEKYFDKITDFAERVSFKLVHRPFKRLRKKYKLKQMANYLSEMEGDTNLICDDLRLFPQQSLPPSYIFTGPLIYQEEKSEDHWLQLIDKSKPVICICMGSTGNWSQLRFFNNVTYSRYTIITAGDYNKTLLAPHILSRNFINLNEVLAVTDLMICHGGNGTIYYGLLKGIYMLCLTSHFEQEWNVHALERIGFGKSANDFTVDQWEQHIIESLKIKLQPFLDYNLVKTSYS